jgi:hypothetical protein
VSARIGGDLGIEAGEFGLRGGDLALTLRQPGAVEFAQLQQGVGGA